MKKIYLTLVLVISMSYSVFAQRSDGFFNSYDNEPYNRIDTPNGLLDMPSKPLGTTSNESAPIGSGLIILTALGAANAIKKKHDKTV